MADYILSKKAQEDLVDIWDYTVETWSEKQADEYFRNLISAFENIATYCVLPNSKKQEGKNY